MTDLHYAIVILALLAAIVLVLRGRPARARRDEGAGGRAAPGREPTAGPAAGDGAPADPLALFAPARSPYTERFAEEPPAPAPVAPKPVPSRIVTLLVVAPAGAVLAGPRVHEALQQAGLAYNPRRLMYQRPLVDTDGHTASEGLFTVANILKPGHLDPAHARQLTTTGVAMFMVLPGLLPAAEAFDDLLQTAELLAGLLGAEIYDQRRQRLTADGAAGLRAELLADDPGAP